MNEFTPGQPNDPGLLKSVLGAVVNQVVEYSGHVGALQNAGDAMIQSKLDKLEGAKLACGMELSEHVLSGMSLTDQVDAREHDKAEQEYVPIIEDTEIELERIKGTKEFEAFLPVVEHSDAVIEEVEAFIEHTA
jgi:hypothetical protein